MHGLHKYLLFHVLACLGPNVLGIIQGEKAKDDSMLYMASIQYNKQHVCGGFLIREDILVSSAHCGNDLKNEELVKVVLGTHDLKKVEKTTTYITKMCKHPSYVDNAKGHDIMLLKLGKINRPRTKGEIIKLPKAKSNIKEIKNCRVAGWGCTQLRGKPVNDLMVMDVSISDPQVCKNKHPSLPADVICAGGNGTKKRLCKGDFGGPLVCNGEAVGVASFYKCDNCNNPDIPDVYTDISNFLPWINNVVNNTSWRNCKK